MQRLTVIREWPAAFGRRPGTGRGVLRRWKIRGRRGEVSVRHRDIRLGLAGTVFVLVLAAASGLLYILPVGQRIYTAELSEAGSVRAGDSVRMAGVPVGRVRSVTLESDRVRMEFAVDDGVFLGADSSLEIRMLTAIGGHYVAVFSAGTAPLGGKHIPPERVRLPYSLSRLFQDAAAPVSAVDGATLRRNFAALRSALEASPDGLRQLGGAVDSIVDVLGRQRQSVSDTLRVADEYLTAIDHSKTVVEQMVTSLNGIATIMANTRTQIDSSLAVVLRLLSRIAAIEPSWRTTLQPLADKLAEALPALQAFGTNLDTAMKAAGELAGRLKDLVRPGTGITVDQSGDHLAAVCVPVPGRGC